MRVPHYRQHDFRDVDRLARLARRGRRRPEEQEERQTALLALAFTGGFVLLALAYALLVEVLT